MSSKVLNGSDSASLALVDTITRSRIALANIAERSTRDVDKVAVSSAKELRDLAGTIQQLGPGWEARDTQAAGLAVNILIVNGDMEP